MYEQGYRAFAAALERGAMASNLERLTLPRFEEGGMAALTRAISGEGRQYVARIRYIGCDTLPVAPRAIADAFWKARREACPLLWHV